MLDAVVDFVRKKSPRFVGSVKILVFQTVMMTEFHNSMKKKQGQGVEEKGLLGKFIDSVSSFFGRGPDQSSTRDLVLEREEFEPAVFQLCGDNPKAVSLAKKRIKDLIVSEQDSRSISDQYLHQLSQEDLDELHALQRKLTVSIHLDRGRDDQEPRIHLEGLTRDVMTAESKVRDIIRKVERKENLYQNARRVSSQVEWKFQDPSGTMVTFDLLTNLKLEEALEKKTSVRIQILNQEFSADPEFRKAVSANGRKKMELLRKDLRGGTGALPPHWDDMKGNICKLVPLAAGGQEYNDVTAELSNAGLMANIISIERVQNTTLWESYRVLKRDMETKNQHQNNEKVLFHGTGADSVDLINSKGFNRSYAGKHGAMFGNGSYFAVSAAYSAGSYARPDPQGHKRLYKARVLVGDFTTGKHGLITPPARSGNLADLYDSVVDRVNAPTMFVIFNDFQAYPEYLVTFI